ncbi:MAG TPA: sigma-70 family RNA polymerase sigma factor [Mycobacteriales bacterium]|nr:sigma-70 family RNA polymerase sigma factor [Mycobacteriales bacterium]
MTTERDVLTELFQQHRPHLRAVAHRMLGSATEADDALQEAWLRVRDRAGAADNVEAWLTTVVARICLNMLRSRRTRREHFVPDPVVRLDSEDGPEREAVLADSVGLALLVVLDALTPAERLAFVLHDLFAVPFAEVATILERSEAAVQQLASRARRRVQAAPRPDPDLAAQRTVVDAFFAASRDGDFEALLEILDPDVELRVDGGDRPEVSQVLRGAAAVAGHTRTYSTLYPYVIDAVVNGAAGAVVARSGKPFSVLAFTVANGRIARIEALIDPQRLALLDIAIPPHGR